VAAGFGVTNIVRFDDTPTGLLWLQWSVLWSVFFVVLALGVTRLTAAAGWLTLVQSFTTCTVPGFVILLGEWDEVTSGYIAASAIAALVVFGVVAARKPADVPDVPATTPADVRVPVSA
jgi:hypothetical protein